MIVYNSMFFSMFRVVKLLPESNFRKFSSTSKENLYSLAVTPHFPVYLPTLALHKQINVSSPSDIPKDLCDQQSPSLPKAFPLFTPKKDPCGAHQNPAH